MTTRSELKFWVHRQSHFRPGVAAPLAAGLAVVPAADSPLGRYPVSVADLAALGITEREALKQAARNAEGDLARKATTDGAGLYTWETDHAGVLAVAGPRVARLLGLKGMPVVMLPTPNLALLASRDDPAALDAMLVVAEVTYDDARDPCTLQALSWEGPLAEPTAWLPPPGHPLRARFIAAAGRARCDALRDAHDACATNEGPLAALHVASDGALVAEWRPGASVVLPAVERVVLRASDDEALEVDFATLREVLPHVAEPLDWATHDLFFRTRAGTFPSLRGRAFLARRSATFEREVGPDDLLAAWDAGEPVLAEAEVAFEGAVRLMHPDRRTAVVSRDRFGARAEALDAIDQAALQASLNTVAAFPLHAVP